MHDTTHILRNATGLRDHLILHLDCETDLDSQQSTGIHPLTLALKLRRYWVDVMWLTYPVYIIDGPFFMLCSKHLLWTPSTSEGT